MDRIKIESLLIQMGITASLKGFRYIRDAILLMDDGWDDVPITRVYWKIAKDNQVGDATVERAIRHALEKARKSPNTELVKRYMGMEYIQNTASLKQFHFILKQEEKEVAKASFRDAMLKRYDELVQSLNEFGDALRRYENSLT